MESTASAVCEFPLLEICEAFSQWLTPYVEVVLGVAEAACELGQECLCCCLETIHKCFESTNSKAVRIGRLPWPEIEALGKKHGLKKFDRLAGSLMFKAPIRCDARLSNEEYLVIARELDRNRFRPKDQFEEAARKKIAENNRNARKAILTFHQALASGGEYCTAAKRRLYRSHDIWKAAFSLSA